MHDTGVYRIKRCELKGTGRFNSQPVIGKCDGGEIVFNERLDLDKLFAAVI